MLYNFPDRKNNIQNFKQSFKKINPLICFAVKSNTNTKLLNEIRKFNIGADVVALSDYAEKLVNEFEKINS